MALGRDCNAAVVGSIPIRGINYYLLIFLLLPCHQGEIFALNDATQHATTQKNSTECRKRSVFTLSSLCLPCHMRDTA